MHIIIRIYEREKKKDDGNLLAIFIFIIISSFFVCLNSIRPRSRNPAYYKHSFFFLIISLLLFSVFFFSSSYFCSMLVIFFVRNTSILIISVISHNRFCPIKFSVYVLNENPLIVWSLFGELCEENGFGSLFNDDEVPIESMHTHFLEENQENERERKRQRKKKRYK